MNKAVLMTGAGGYIGSNAIYLFLQNGYDIIAVDNFSTGYRESLELLQKKFGLNKLRVYETDLTNNLDFIFEKEKNIQMVVHFAASCEVNESMKNPQKYFTNNTAASQNLLQTIIKYNIRDIVFSSTCAVYGEASYMPVDEKHPTNPTNPYGLSKRMTEQMIEWYGKIHGLNYMILRYFNVCGASDDGILGDSKRPSIHLVQNVVRDALGIESFFLTCPQVDTKDKTPIRDYVNVVDLCEAHLLAVEYLLQGGSSEIINLGTGKGNSVLEIVNKVSEIKGKIIENRKTQVRDGEYAVMIASTDKAKNLLKWMPTHTLTDSITSSVAWYTAHPHGWEK